MINIAANQILEMEKLYRVNLLNGLTGYKPLNLLGTINPDGVTNLCIVSSVFHMGSNPPLFGMVMRPQRPDNDSLKNIKATGEYTLNNVLPDWYKQAHQTSASYPSGVSEFEKCDFTELFDAGFKPPFVEQSTIRIGLKLQSVSDVAGNGTSVVIGEVVKLLIDDAIIDEDGTVDHIKAGTMAGSGLDTYYSPQLVGRLSYAKPDKAIETL